MNNDNDMTNIEQTKILSEMRDNTVDYLEKVVKEALADYGKQSNDSSKPGGITARGNAEAEYKASRFGSQERVERTNHGTSRPILQSLKIPLKIIGFIGRILVNPLAASLISAAAGISAFILFWVDFFGNDLSFILLNSPWQTAFIALIVLALVFFVIHAISMFMEEGSWPASDSVGRGILVVISIVCCVVVFFTSAALVDVENFYQHLFFQIIPFAFAAFFAVLNIICGGEITEKGMGFCLVSLLLCCYCGGLAWGGKIYAVEQGNVAITRYEGITNDYLLYRTLDDDTLAITVYQYVSENLKIPESIGGKKVTVIESMGDEHDNKSDIVRQIIIPDSVTSIGSGAFSHCSGLTRVTIGSDVKFIDEDAFSECYRLVEVFNKSSLDITAGSSSYGEVAFNAINVYAEIGGSQLVTDSNGFVFLYNEEQSFLVDYIGGKTEIALPGGFTAKDGTVIQAYEINFCAFYCRQTITSVTIPSSVTGIGRYAFYKCDELNSATFRDVDGWYVLDSDGNRYQIDDIGSRAIAAGYLRSEYRDCYWIKV